MSVKYLLYFYVLLTTWNVVFCVFTVERLKQDVVKNYGDGQCWRIMAQDNVRGNCQCQLQVPDFVPQENEELKCRKIEDINCHISLDISLRTHMITKKSFKSKTKPLLLGDECRQLNKIFLWNVIETPGTWKDVTNMVSHYFRISSQSELTADLTNDQWRGQLVKIVFGCGKCTIFKVAGEITYPFNVHKFALSTPQWTTREKRTTRKGKRTSLPTRVSSKQPTISSLKPTTPQTTKQTTPQTTKQTTPQTTKQASIAKQTTMQASTSLKTTSTTSGKTLLEAGVIVLIIGVLLIAVATIVLVVLCRHKLPCTDKNEACTNKNDSEERPESPIYAEVNDPPSNPYDYITPIELNKNLETMGNHNRNNGMGEYEDILPTTVGNVSDMYSALNTSIKSGANCTEADYDNPRDEEAEYDTLARPTSEHVQFGNPVYEGSAVNVIELNNDHIYHEMEVEPGE